MVQRVDYPAIIRDIESSKSDRYELTQDKAKRIGGQELPKSLFDKSYLKKGRNALCRFFLDNGYDIEIVEPKLIVKK